MLAAAAGAAVGSPAAAAAATLLLALALIAGRAAPIPAALLLLGAMYVIPDGDRAVPAPVYAGTLLLVAELAYWSLDERAPVRAERGIALPRLLGILAVATLGVAAAAVVLLAAESDVARSPGATAAGVGAILACVAILARLVRA